MIQQIKKSVLSLLKALNPLEKKEERYRNTIMTYLLLKKRNDQAEVFKKKVLRIIKINGAISTAVSTTVIFSAPLYMTPYLLIVPILVIVLFNILNSYQQINFMETYIKNIDDQG